MNVRFVYMAAWQFQGETSVAHRIFAANARHQWPERADGVVAATVLEKLSPRHVALSTERIGQSHRKGSAPLFRHKTHVFPWISVER
jgi:hypothetical protein